MDQQAISNVTISGTLTPFARGQVLFALLAGGPELIQFVWGLFRGADPTSTVGTLVVTIICIAAALTGIMALRLLSSNQTTVASVFFVLATVVCITAALPFQGARSNLVLYVWPTVAAALLLGNRFGAVVAIICTIAGGVSYVMDVTGIYHPIIQGWLYDGQNIFDAGLALGLVVIAANVAGREIHQALAAASAQGEQFHKLYIAAKRAALTLKDGAAPIASSLASAATEQAQLVLSQSNAVQELAEQTGSLATTANASAELAVAQRILNEQATKAVSAAAAELTQAAILVDAGVSAVYSVKKGISDIGARSEKVKRVLDNLRSILSEVHILGLNAAIESAQAGENGRRFGVIAHELSELTSSINGNIDEVSDLIGFEQLVEAVTSQVGEVVSRFEGIRQRMNQTEAQMELARHEIAEADTKSLEMAATTTQGASAVRQADEASRQIAATTQQTSRATSEFQDSARELSSMLIQLDDQLTAAEIVAASQGTNGTNGTPPSSSLAAPITFSQPVLSS